MKKKINFLALICIGLAGIIQGCYYDNYEVVNPAAGLVNMCDTVSAIKYSKQVSTVFNGYCNSCHSAALKNGNVILDNYSDVLASKTRIIGSMRHSSGYKAMPPGTSVDECSIREVEIWIQNGAINN